MNAKHKGNAKWQSQIYYTARLMMTNFVKIRSPLATAI